VFGAGKDMLFHSNEPHNQMDRDSPFVIAGLFPCLLRCEYLASQQFLFHSVATHLEDARNTKFVMIIKAGVFYNVKNGSSFITSVSSSDNLST
jgi:hypothetical protein